MSSNGSSPSPDPAELVRSIEATRDSLAETVDAIAEKVSPKRVAARTKDSVRQALQGGAANVSAGVDAVKQKVSGPPPLDLAEGSTPRGGSAALGPGTSGPQLPVRPEVLGGALAALLLLLVVRRRRAARLRRRKTGLAALLDR